MTIDELRAQSDKLVRELTSARRHIGDAQAHAIQFDNWIRGDLDNRHAGPIELMECRAALDSLQDYIRAAGYISDRLHESIGPKDTAR